MIHARKKRDIAEAAADRLEEDQAALHGSVDTYLPTVYDVVHSAAQYLDASMESSVLDIVAEMAEKVLSVA